MRNFLCLLFIKWSFVPARSAFHFYLFFSTTLETLKIKACVILQACYVFIMKKVNEAFIYIRDFSISKQVEKCLKFGEEFAVESNYLVN